MQRKLLHQSKHIVFITTMSISLFLSSCYTYRVQTHAQAGSEEIAVNSSSFFWGLVQSPKAGITTPLCDSLDVNGMSVVRVKTNLGYALITVLSLGIWCPMKIYYRCSKPCQKIGHL